MSDCGLLRMSMNASTMCIIYILAALGAGLILAEERSHASHVTECHVVLKKVASSNS